MAPWHKGTRKRGPRGLEGMNKDGTSARIPRAVFQKDQPTLASAEALAGGGRLPNLLKCPSLSMYVRLVQHWHTSAFLVAGRAQKNARPATSEDGRHRP